MIAVWLIASSACLAQEDLDRPPAFLAEVPPLGIDLTNREVIPPSPDDVVGTARTAGEVGSLDRIALSNSMVDAESGPGSLTADLIKRLAEIEKQLKKRDEADKKGADAAAKKFTVRPFGRVHIDAAAFNQDRDNKLTVGECLNGVDIRRARLGVEGEGFDTFFYRFDMDFVTFDQGSNSSQSSKQRPIIVDAYFDCMTFNFFITG